MSTLKQIEANRLNAKKSTGPRTAQGKSVSRLNALKHGLFATDPIIPGEDPAHLEALHTSHYDQFQPATPHEHVLLAAMVRDAWTLERFSNLETAVWTRSMERESKDPFPLAMSHAWIASQLTQIQRRLDAAQRNYRRNLELLIKLQTARQSGAGASACQPVEPLPQPQSPEPLNSEIGFVPPNPSSPPPTAPPTRLPIPGRSAFPELPPEAA